MGLKSTLRNVIGAVVVNGLVASTAMAEDAAKVADSGILSSRAAAVLAMGIAVFGASNAQAKAIAAALESIGRNPGAAGSMFLLWLLALVFIESLVLFTLVIAFQII